MELLDSEGRLARWDAGLQEVISSYFSHLFTAENVNLEPITDCLERKVTEDFNASLLAPITKEEVYAALMQIILIKLLGRMVLLQDFFRSTGK